MGDRDATDRHLQQLHGDCPGIRLLAQRHHGVTRRVFTPTTTEAVDAAATGDNDGWTSFVAPCLFDRDTTDRTRDIRPHVETLPGVWADLDVQPDLESHFHTPAEVDRYAAHLPEPTVEVHAGDRRFLFWLTHHPMEVTGGAVLLHAWLDYLRVTAAGRVITDIRDTIYVMPLAGTGDAVIARDHGPRYHADELRLTARAAHTEAEALRGAAPSRLHGPGSVERRRRFEDNGLPVEHVSLLITEYESRVDWAPILEATGWTLESDRRTARDRAARCRYWTRPGGIGRSAATDRVADDGTITPAMTIYSLDESLNGLWENTGTSDAHGICGKWNYTLQRLYDGDEVALLRDTATRLRRGEL